MGSKTLEVDSGSRIPAEVFEGGIIFSINTLFKQGIRRFAISFTWIVFVSLPISENDAIFEDDTSLLGFITGKGFTV